VRQPQRGTTLTASRLDFESVTFARVAWRLVPLLFLGYIVAFLDRVNVGFAQLQMARDLAFSDAVYGFGAGIFFIGYFLFEVPSNLILSKVGARIWIARIMITWGLISSSFMFIGAIPWGPVSAAFGCTDEQFTFYVLRFLLGAAEAGFFPGVILYLTPCS
jgi:sugar phosphate permease